MSRRWAGAACCMLQVGSEGWGGWYAFRYLDGSGDAFTISVGNLRFMRRAT